MVKLQKHPKLSHIKNQNKTHKQYNPHFTFKQKNSHTILGNHFIPEAEPMTESILWNCIKFRII